MAAIVGRWRAFMATGCWHGEFGSWPRAKEVLKFKKTLKPHYVVDLGDFIDTAAFRSGAHGTADSARDPVPDMRAGLKWLEMLEPTHITYGNHDVRLVKLSSHPDAIVSYAASTLWNDVQTTVSKLKAKTVPYNIRNGWHDIEGVLCGHGYMYNENAIRDHVEMNNGQTTVHAHTHRPGVAEARTRLQGTGYCVGTLSNIDSLEYAATRRSTLAWGHGCVWGYVCQGKRPNLYLTRSDAGEPLRFPL